AARSRARLRPHRHIAKRRGRIALLCRRRAEARIQTRARRISAGCCRSGFAAAGLRDDRRETPHLDSSRDGAARLAAFVTRGPSRGRPRGRRSETRRCAAQVLPGWRRMTMLFVLIVQLLHRVRRFLLAAGVLLAGFQVVLILQANSIQASNSFAKMGDLVPSFAREVLGPSFVTFLTFKGIVCLG